MHYNMFSEVSFLSELQKFDSLGGTRCNNQYLCAAMARELFILSFCNPTVSNKGDWHNTYFLSRCSVPDGSLEAAWFVSVLWRQRQVDKS